MEQEKIMEKISRYWGIKKEEAEEIYNESFEDDLCHYVDEGKVYYKTQEEAYDYSRNGGIWNYKDLKFFMFLNG